MHLELESIQGLTFNAIMALREEPTWQVEEKSPVCTKGAVDTRVHVKRCPTGADRR